MSYGFLKLMQDFNTRITNSLNQKGQLAGQIADVATIQGRAEPIQTTLQHLSSTGTFAASAVTGTLMPANLPAASLGSIGGVEANNPTPHEWVNSISAGGVPQLSQPGFGDIAGSVLSAQLPTPTIVSLGGVMAVAASPSEWVNAIDPTGTPQLSQPAFTDISGQITTSQLPAAGVSGTIHLAALTGLGAQGSITVTNGLITAFVDPT